VLFRYDPTLTVPNSEIWDGPFTSEKLCEAKKTIAEAGPSPSYSHPSSWKCVSFHRDAE
jgi:hypothetical protein